MMKTPELRGVGSLQTPVVVTAQPLAIIKSEKRCHLCCNDKKTAASLFLGLEYNAYVSAARIVFLG